MITALLILLTGFLYLRGWLAIRKTRADIFTLARLLYFFSALTILWIALAEPMDELADNSLSAHMLQHLLLMSAVPPLLLLGYPLVPLLRAVPSSLRSLLNPLFLLPGWLFSPLIAWILMNAVFLGWHVPSAYDFALTHEYWHRFEHLCFLTSSLIFWWWVITPWPARTRPNGWGILLYLVSADLVNTALSAFLAFCDRPVYIYYLTHSNPFQLSTLSDQVLGAAIMWVGGSFAFLAPAILITFKLLQAPSHRLA